MKTKFKRIASLALCLVLALALAAPALADGEAYNGATKTTVDTTANTIPLVKEIIFFNPDSSYDVREPSITYTYTVAPVTSDITDATVTDAAGHKGEVKYGVADGVTGGDITFGAASATAKDTNGGTGTPVGKTLAMAVNLTKFDHAGIYRYLITETAKTDAELKAVGIEARDTTYTTTRYLDVYIGNKSGGGLELKGAVIFKPDTTAADRTIDNTDTDNKKTVGFVSETGSDFGDDKDVDKYYTYNLEVTKTTTGALADLNHKFPYDVTLTVPSAHTSAVTIDVSVKDSKAALGYTGHTQEATQALNTGDNTVYAGLANAGTLIIKGIPVDSTVLVKETNDTYDGYKASLTAAPSGTTTTGVDLTATAVLVKDATTQLNAVVKLDGGQAKLATAAIAKTEIGLTNTLEEISPTGVVLRVAPYAILLGAGVVLLMAASRRREEEEDA